ncbi:hypothetical protein, partial [Aminipila sp.]|uniref:hypothetical protein n=1 Tax=Aminipila sp. TaxID=2060095 RepID=UPI00289A093D
CAPNLIYIVNFSRCQTRKAQISICSFSSPYASAAKPSAPFRNKELLYIITIPQICQHLFSNFSSLISNSSFAFDTRYCPLQCHI